MGQICEHADIQPRPCPGSIFSKEIVCKAGHENKCLRKCSAGCPSYKVKKYEREKINPPVSFASQQMSPVSSSQLIHSQPARSMNVATSGAARTSKCGTCGGR